MGIFSTVGCLNTWKLAQTLVLKSTTFALLTENQVELYLIMVQIQIFLSKNYFQ